MSCMTRANGDKGKADYLADCSYFMYYYRIVEYNWWASEQEKQIAKINNK